ncbi:MAG: family 20 glycosylhydrolase [Phycisphaerales bacterium]|nr:family 20 glycosylhydrolase [Phycisphaerales bacterium]
MNAPAHALAGGPPVLLPRPREVHLTGGLVRLAGLAEPEHRHAPMPAEAYRLRIEGSPRARVVVESSDPAGERHARATLAQLIRQYGHDLPALDIADAPAIADRGVMLDVSRCRVPTMDELRRTVNLLASLKFNHLQLYTEHTFAYDGHEDIWGGCDPLTPDEARTLDGWCRDRGIALTPNQNCFGHLRRWLRHPRYAPLAETHGLFRFLEWDRLGPHSLCPDDPGALRLVEGWLDQLLPCFSAGQVNLGCDETFDVGAGRSRPAAERDGAGAVRLGFVGRLCRAALRRGVRPMIWGDMLAAHAEHAHVIPPEAVALMWGYEPDIDFDALINAARRTCPERRCWVCPGTSSWLSITGRGAERTATLRRAARAASSAGADGFMVCDWGDQGHRQQWPVTLRALADAAEAAWTGAPAARPSAAAEGLGARVGLACPHGVSLHLFGDPSGRISPALDALSQCDAHLRSVCGGTLASPRPLKNASALYRDLHTPLGEPFPAGAMADPRADAGTWEEVAIPARQVREATEALSPQVRHEVEITLDTALVARDRAIARRTGLAGGRARDLADRMDDLIARSRDAWRARSREGGREESERFDLRVRDELRIAAGAAPAPPARR